MAKYIEKEFGEFEDEVLYAEWLPPIPEIEDEDNFEEEREAAENLLNLVEKRD